MPKRHLSLIVLFAAVCAMAGAQDRSTPESTVRSFLAAFERADVKQAATCVKGVTMSPGAMDVFVQQIKKDPATFTPSGLATTVNGNTAVVSGQVTLKSSASTKTESFPTKVNLERGDGGWLIVPDAARARQDEKPDIVNALAYVLTDTKVLEKARDSARNVSCLSNVKQICTGLLMYLQDYDDAFKLSAATYKKSVMPYVKSEDVFHCPADKSGGVSYSFNSALAGIKSSKIHAPAQTVMVYEGKGGQLTFRHDGKAAVGFADGHAKLIDAAGAKSLRWKP